jgi:hypothetical protein
MSNQFINLTITIEDISIADKKLCADIDDLKEKTPKTIYVAEDSDYIEIPGEFIDNHQIVILCIDGIKISGLPFLPTVSQSVIYGTAEPVPPQTTSAYRSAIPNVFRIFTTAGFRTPTIFCFNEFQPLIAQKREVYSD